MPYEVALQALVQALCLVERSMSHLSRRGVLDAVSYLCHCVDSGKAAAGDPGVMTSLEACADGLTYVNRLCRLRKSMWMHLSECVGKITRPDPGPQVDVEALEAAALQPREATASRGSTAMQRLAEEGSATSGSKQHDSRGSDSRSRDSKSGRQKQSRRSSSRQTPVGTPSLQSEARRSGSPRSASGSKTSRPVALQS